MATGANLESRNPNPGTLPLLIEIGCEEIPARFLAGAQKEFGERLQEALQKADLLVGAEREPPLQTYSTPRRLVAHLPEILGNQPDKAEEVRGPAARVAFDAQGRPTRAAESFAAKNGAAVQDLIKVSTPKGDYVAVQKRIPGRPALEVLPEILPSVITGFSFPKSMYWEKSKTRFIRPIRWILALLGEGEAGRVVPFEIAGVETSNVTYGHRGLVELPGRPFARGSSVDVLWGSTAMRSLGAQGVPVSSFTDYAAKLRGLGVEFDPEARRRRLKVALQALPVMSQLEGIQEIGREQHNLPQELLARIKALPEVPDVNVVGDKELEEWVVNSTECPRALIGTFGERFLQLPREILVTVMRDHQKYFAVEDRAGRLQPKFIASLNLDSDPKGLIRAGHERVLAARFADAEFFWNADQKIPLAVRFDEDWLERVMYQAQLGSYGDKVRRMAAIANAICAQLENQGRMAPQQRAHTLRAVRLSKCDLTTQMVQEFTELQGVVGGLYAAAQGEPKDVADAIYDHYLPEGVEDKCPRSVVGAVVSLADKIDSVTAAFAVGNEPTGSSDPFSLRRQGYGVVKTILQASLPVSLEAVLDRALESVQVPRQKSDTDIARAVLDFLGERLRFHLEQVEGLRYDTVRAVLSAAWWQTEPTKMFECARDLEKIRSSPDFLGLSQSAKRIRNILRKSAKPEDYQGGHLDPNALEPGPELGLYEAYSRVDAAVNAHKSAGEYYPALELIATLRPAVDLFFDKVLVMAENADLRRNRLQLLLQLERLFNDIADLSEIEAPVSEIVESSHPSVKIGDRGTRTTGG